MTKKKESRKTKVEKPNQNTISNSDEETINKFEYDGPFNI